METSEVITFIVALLGGGGGLKLVQLVADSRSKRMRNRRAEVDRVTAEKEDLEADLSSMEAELESERSMRRRLEESLSLHRRLMYEANCIEPGTVPPWPGKE